VLLDTATSVASTTHKAQSGQGLYSPTIGSTHTSTDTYVTSHVQPGKHTRQYWPLSCSRCSRDLPR
jgi:hypothetical protein